MHVSLKFILASILLIASPQAGAVAHLDTSGLNHDELASYLQCRQSGFHQDGCESVLVKVCQVPGNQDDWDCIGSAFEACSHIDYASSSCEGLLERVCRLTGDQYSDACDRYHYEVCARKDIAGPDCPDIRVKFTLPTIIDTVDAEAKGSQRRVGALSKLIRETACAKSHSDKTNPLYVSCLPEPEDDGPISLDQFETAYQNAQRAGKLTTTLKIELFQRFLRSQPSSDLFDQAETMNLWLREDDAAAISTEAGAQMARALALRALAERGDDSVTTTFLLVQVAKDDNPAVRLAALQGLGIRSYQSGLAVLALIQALQSEIPDERTAALSGLARRWDKDLQASYFGRLDAKQLGSLLDCRNVQLDQAIYDRVRTMSDTMTIDLSSPRSLCSIGQGARLFQLKHEIWATYIRTARDGGASDSERSAALTGLALISVGDPSTQAEAHSLATLILQTTTVPGLRRDALALLYATTEHADRPRMKLVYAAVAAELESLLASDTLQLLELEKILSLAQDVGLIGGVDDDGSVKVDSVLPLLRDQCISRDDLAKDIRTLCFTAASPALEPTIEAAFWPVFLDLLSSHIYEERSAALTLLEKRAITFVDLNRRTVNCERREEVANLVANLTNQTLNAKLGENIALFNELWRVLAKVSSESDEIRRCPRLADARLGVLAAIMQPPIDPWLKAVMAEDMPKLLVKEWYDAYKPEHRVDVIERLDQPKGRGDPTHGYRIRQDLLLSIRTVLDRRTPDDLLLRDLAWSGLQEAYHAAKTAADTKRSTEASLQFEFWGVTMPATSHKRIAQ